MEFQLVPDQIYPEANPERDSAFPTLIATHGKSVYIT